MGNYHSLNGKEIKRECEKCHRTQLLAVSSPIVVITLPLELWHCIHRFLDWDSKIAFRRTCSAFDVFYREWFQAIRYGLDYAFQSSYHECFGRGAPACHAHNVDYHHFRAIQCDSNSINNSNLNLFLRSASTRRSNNVQWEKLSGPRIESNIALRQAELMSCISMAYLWHGQFVVPYVTFYNPTLSDTGIIACLVKASQAERLFEDYKQERPRSTPEKASALLRKCQEAVDIYTKSYFELTLPCVECTHQCEHCVDIVVTNLSLSTGSTWLTVAVTIDWYYISAPFMIGTDPALDANNNLNINREFFTALHNHPNLRGHKSVLQGTLDIPSSWNGSLLALITRACITLLYEKVIVHGPVFTFNLWNGLADDIIEWHYRHFVPERFDAMLAFTSRGIRQNAAIRHVLQDHIILGH